VTAFTPRGQGAREILAEVRGFWVEGGRITRPVAPALLTLDLDGGIGLVTARGAHVEPGPPGLTARAPSLLFDDARIEPL